MCLLLALQRRGELWIAANRDERLDRPWSPPRLVSSEPPVVAGIDLLAGGSWLAVNLASRFVVSVTNARLGARSRERSRGQLVLDAAMEPGPEAAVALLAELDLSRYGAFNLLVADRSSLWLATNEPGARLSRSERTAFALGNDPIDRPSERVMAAERQAAALLDADDQELRAGLIALLASHDGADPICRHGVGYGTVSSSLVVIRASGEVEMAFAPGPPCVIPYDPVDLT